MREPLEHPPVAEIYRKVRVRYLPNSGPTVHLEHPTMAETSDLLQELIGKCYDYCPRCGLKFPEECECITPPPAREDIPKGE